MSKKSKGHGLKFYKKSFTLLYRILILINKGQYPTQIARTLGKSKQSIKYHIDKLERQGYIKLVVKSNAKFYELTDKGKQLLKDLKDQSKKFSLPTSEEMRLHNLAIKFPILKDNPNFKWDKANQGLKNWMEQYKRLPEYGITLKKTTNHIIVYLHQFMAKDFSEFLNKITLSIAVVNTYLSQNGIKIDIFGGKVISQHLALTVNKKIEDGIKRMLNQKNITAEVDLNRLAKSVYPTDLKAKAWIDHSLGRMEIETNDLEYIENFLLMPERVARFERLGEFIITQQVAFAKNLELHLKVLKNIGESIKELNKTIKELNKK